MAISSCWFNKLIKSTGKHIFDVVWNTTAPCDVKESIKEILPWRCCILHCTWWSQYLSTMKIEFILWQPFLSANLCFDYIMATSFCLYKYLPPYNTFRCGNDFFLSIQFNQLYLSPVGKTLLQEMQYSFPTPQGKLSSLPPDGKGIKAPVNSLPTLYSKCALVCSHVIS